MAERNFFTIFWIFLTFFGFVSVNGQSIMPVQTSNSSAVFNVRYLGTVTNNAPMTYFYARTTTGSTAVRVTVTRLEATEDSPILIIIKRQRSVLSWQIPLILEEKFQYNSTSRTLCPMDNYASGKNLLGESNDMILTSMILIFGAEMLPECCHSPINFFF
jgi:hypothetical protein